MQNLSKFTQLKQLTLVSSKLIRLRCMKSSIRETKIHNPNYNGWSEQMPTLKCGITPKKFERMVNYLNNLSLTPTCLLTLSSISKAGTNTQPDTVPFRSVLHSFKMMSASSGQEVSRVVLRGMVKKKKKTRKKTTVVDINMLWRENRRCQEYEQFLKPLQKHTD